MDETYLWPIEERRTPLRNGARSELVDVYPNRASVPRDLWISLVLGAMKQIDVFSVLRNLLRSEKNPCSPRAPGSGL